MPFRGGGARFGVPPGEAGADALLAVGCDSPTLEVPLPVKIARNGMVEWMMAGSTHSCDHHVTGAVPPANFGGGGSYCGWDGMGP